MGGPLGPGWRDYTAIIIGEIDFAAFKHHGTEHESRISAGQPQGRTPDLASAASRS